MRSPKDMEVIQIEITNACVRVCSNCTRFCGHHKKPYFMDFETFKKAVDSLEGYTGIVGIMGGEPTIHPLFEQFTQYLNSKFKTRGNLKAARKPLRDFLTYTRAKHNANRVLNKCAGPGLWTSITPKYQDYYELIQNVFTFQSLNDHSKTSYHHPLLVSRKDLGIEDREWLKLRDKCWIQSCWSASITPKGAFFCEVAASLDMLFDGPGGWPLESSWWSVEPSEFGNQYNWCEICGGALKTFRRDAGEGIYDITPSVYEKLKQTESPLIKKNKLHVFDSNNFEATKEYMDFNSNQYIDDFSNRISDSAKYLVNFPIDRIYAEPEDFGHSIYKAITGSKFDWLCYCEKEPDNLTELLKELSSRYLNKGILYQIAEGVFLFNKKSRSLAVFGGDGILNSRVFKDIAAAYPPDKIISVNLSEDELAVDELLWLNQINDDFLKGDPEFRKAFESTILSNAPKGSDILITQTASFFLTSGLIAILKDMGMNVFLITHKRFAEKFIEFDKSQMLVFDQKDYFDFELLKPHLEKIGKHFAGTVIPYSVPRSVIVDKDGYQNIEKSANFLAPVIARVNIKREFVKIAFDINGEIYNNQWNY